MLALSLRQKFSAALVLAAGLSLFLTVLALTQLFEDQVKSATASRALFVVRQIREAVEAGLNFGLRLGSLYQTQALIERERALAGEVHSILIFDSTGTILFSTVGAEIRERVPASWMTAQQRAGGGEWQVEDDTHLVVGANLDSGFGTSAGSVALRLPHQTYIHQVEHFALEIGAVALGGLATAALFSWGVFFGLSWRDRHTLIAAAERWQRPSPFTTGEPDATAPGRLDAGVDPGEFDRWTRTSLHRLRRAEADVQRLDETA